MITKLLEREDVSEELELRSTFGFMAYHGGSLEKATDVTVSYTHLTLPTILRV